VSDNGQWLFGFGKAAPFEAPRRRQVLRDNRFDFTQKCKPYI
jgi:hypothetical protein